METEKREEVCGIDAWGGEGVRVDKVANFPGRDLGEKG